MVAVDHINLFAGAFFKFAELLCHRIVILGKSASAVRKVARNKHIINVITFSALIKKFINNKSAFILHSTASVCVPDNRIVVCLLKLSLRGAVMEIGRHGNFKLVLVGGISKRRKSRKCEQHRHQYRNNLFHMKTPFFLFKRSSE